MPNTVHGPYSGTTCVNGVTPLNATLGNLIQTQSAVALASFNPDLLTAFVLSGITCIKDGVTANQLDIASGEAYVKMTDGTLARIDVVTDNTHTTATPSTTYHLYLQPDGTWYWSTSNSPQTNSLAICTVTTDGSGNISVVTDARVTFTALLSGMSGHINIPKLGQVNDQATVGGYGVPTIVAQTVRQHVTVTTLNTLLTYVVGASGIYRVSGYVATNNSGANPALKASMGAGFDPDTGFTSGAQAFATALPANTGGVAHGATLLDGTATWVGVGSTIYLLPQVVAATAAGSILCNYQDPSGTPSDYVTFIIERLA